MELEGPKQQVVARDGLVVRERYDVSSAKIGELPAGTKCTVYDVIETPGDITRARIVANSGPLAGTEGWVTTVFTSGASGTFVRLFNIFAVNSSDFFTAACATLSATLMGL